MSTMTPEAPVEHPAIEKIAEDLDLERLMSFTLADAIRAGACHTTKKEGGWIEGGAACALGAAWLAAKAAKQIV